MSWTLNIYIQLLSTNVELIRGKIIFLNLLLFFKTCPEQYYLVVLSTPPSISYIGHFEILMYFHISKITIQITFSWKKCVEFVRYFVNWQWSSDNITGLGYNQLQSFGRISSSLDHCMIQYTKTIGTTKFLAIKNLSSAVFKTYQPA